VGDESFYVNSPAETIIMCIFLMFNIALQAFILGGCGGPGIHSAWGRRDVELLCWWVVAGGWSA